MATGNRGSGEGGLRKKNKRTFAAVDGSSAEDGLGKKYGGVLLRWRPPLKNSREEKNHMDGSSAEDGLGKKYGGVLLRWRPPLKISREEKNHMDGSSAEDGLGKKYGGVLLRCRPPLKFSRDEKNHNATPESESSVRCGVTWYSSAEGGIEKYEQTFAAVDGSSAEDGLAKKYKQTLSAVDASFSRGVQNHNGTPEFESSVRCGAVVLDERLWKTLPEEILYTIVERLPYPAQCRLRCVCRKWRGFASLLSPPPPCTIVRSGWGDGNAKFYCDSEERWFSLPPQRHLGSPFRSWTWTLADIDAGLACYESNQDGRFWFCVCNPLKPSSSRIIPPKDICQDFLGSVKSNPPRSKLLVDRAKKTFKLVTRLDLLCGVPWTTVYDSTTACWSPFHSIDYIASFRYFSVKNVVYAYNTRDIPLIPDAFVISLNEEQGRWISINAEPPSEFRPHTYRFFLSDNNKVILVLFSLVLFSTETHPQPVFSVWKPANEGSRCTQSNLLFERENWEKVAISSVQPIVDLAGHNLARASYGAGQMCFVFKDDRIMDDGSKGYGASVHKYLRYSFETDSWSLMPCPRDLKGEQLELCNWEPSLIQASDNQEFVE